MLMVIFGAGASYDSAQAYRPPTQRGNDGQPWRPPLANDLFLDRHHVFGHIVTKYPRLIQILPLLRHSIPGRSVEQLLESLQKEAEGYPERQCQFAAVRYYIRDLISEVTEKWLSQIDGLTNYAPLVDQILRRHQPNEPVCLVTFNYDLLLESALRTFGFTRRLPEEHFNSHPILKLFKLHGSVDWMRYVDSPTDIGLSANSLIDVASSITLSKKYTISPGNTMMSERGKLLFPAIAIPVQTKTQETFECPPSHLSYLCDLLKSVTKILIIGWQAREEHFLGLLRTNLPPLQRIMVVSGGLEAPAILEGFMNAIGPATRTAIPETAMGGFTDFVVNQEGDEFFRT